VASPKPKLAFLYVLAIILGLLIPILVYVFLSAIAAADYLNPTFCRVYDRTASYYMVECSVDVFNSQDNGIVYIFSLSNMTWNSLNISMVKSAYFNNYAVMLKFYNETDNYNNPISVVISSLQPGIYNDLNATNGFALNITYYNPVNGSYFDMYFDLTPTGGYSVHILNGSYLIASLWLRANPTEKPSEAPPSPPSNPWDIFGWLRFIAYLIALGIQFLMAGLQFIPVLLGWILKVGALAVLIIPIHIIVAFAFDPVKGVEAVKFWYNLFRILGEWLIKVLQALANLIDSLLPG